MAEFDTVIRGGTLATASDLFTADLGIANGKISVIGMNLGRLPPRSTHSSHARAAILAALSPAGPAPTNQYIDIAPHRSVRRVGCERLRIAWRRGAHVPSADHFRQAGPLLRPAVDRDQTLKACPNATP